MFPKLQYLRSFLKRLNVMTIASLSFKRKKLFYYNTHNMIRANHSINYIIIFKNTKIIEYK
jgi:hypothetical protein